MVLSGVAKWRLGGGYDATSTRRWRYPALWWYQRRDCYADLRPEARLTVR
jgi:hypothetical protein